MLFHHANANMSHFRRVHILLPHPVLIKFAAIDFIFTHFEKISIHQFDVTNNLTEFFGAKNLQDLTSFNEIFLKTNHFVKRDVMLFHIDFYSSF